MLLPNKVKWHVIHLLVQRRVLIFLASSSGFKGFWKPSFLKAKPFLGVNLFYEIFFGPATTPSRLFLFVFLVSPVTGTLQQQIGNANRLHDQILHPGGGFEDRIMAVSFQFCFVEKERCNANMLSEIGARMSGMLFLLSQQRGDTLELVCFYFVTFVCHALLLFSVYVCVFLQAMTTALAYVKTEMWHDILNPLWSRRLRVICLS